jgi:hypothetical protein
VAVLVERHAVVVDEVVGGGPALLVEVGRAAVPAGGAVGDAGVDHGHDRAPATGGRGLARIRPRLRGVHAELAREVPLEVGPVAAAAAAWIVRQERAGRLRGADPVVRHGVLHARLVLQLANGGGDRLAVLDLQDPRAAGEHVVEAGPAVALHVGALGPRRVLVVAHENAVPGVRRRRRSGCDQREADGRGR